MKQSISFNDSLECCISTLPDDVLLEIFFYLCDESVDVARPADGVWHLRQICSRWRNLVHSTPSLWNEFHVPDLLGGHRFYPSAVARQIQACLEYSQTALLSVAITYLPESAAANETLRRAILGIASHAHRLTYLRIGGRILEDIFGDVAFPVDLPSLRTLSVTECRNSAAYRFLRGANSLENVIISHSKLPTISDFPWANVKRLAVSSANSATEPTDFNISALFDALSRLEELTWRSNHAVDTLRAGFSCPIFLPQLHSLTIDHSSELRNVIPMLRIPLLSNFTLRGQTDSDAVPLQRMIRMSECCVKELKMHQTSSSVVIHVLDELDDLEYISLRVETVEEIREILASKAFLLPSLRTISIDAQNNEEEDEGPQLAGILIDGLRRIMSSRFSLTGRQNLLRVVECKVSVADDAYDTFKSMACDLEELGEKLGIQVVLVPQEIEIITGFLLVD